MADQDLYRGMIRIHVLYHASKESVFGLGMMQELLRHGYRIGPGTLYPLLHGMENRGYLKSVNIIVNGRRNTRVDPALIMVPKSFSASRFTAALAGF